MTQPIQVRQTSNTAKSSCQYCSLSNLCLPLALDSSEMDQLDDVVNRDRIFNRGELVFTQSAPFHSCFAVKSGAIKTSVVTESGEEQITGFFMPGDLVGLDSMSDEEKISWASDCITVSWPFEGEVLRPTLHVLVGVGLSGPVDSATGSVIA